MAAFTRCDVWNSLRKSLSGPAELTAALALLQEANYVLPDGGRWRVNPAWDRAA